MILCKGKAGLGNRLLSAAGSILYAKITGRSLYIDWSDRGYSHDRGNSWPRFFAAPVLPDPAPFYQSRSVAPHVWRGHLDKSTDELMELCGGDHDRDTDPRVTARYTIDFRRVDYKEDLLVRWRYSDEAFLLRPHLPPELRGLDDDTVVRRVLQKDVVLAPDLRQRVDAFRASQFGDVTIGLHIRASDRKMPFHRYPELADRILSRHPRAVIFLATDNQEVEGYIRGRYKRVVTAEKWFAQPGTPLHRTRDCPNKTEMGASGIVDMYLLGACDYLVYNRTTTFGLCASLLSTAPQRNLYETSPPADILKDLLRRVKRRVSLALPVAR